jgi:DNA (cytosine-5)-methyltransferase 1
MKSSSQSRVVVASPRLKNGSSEITENGAHADSNAFQLLSLFCGPGGLDEGFKRAGFCTRLAYDIDLEAVRTFNLNHCHDGHAEIAHQKDLRDLTLRGLLRSAGENFAPVGIIGGPPCQSFSVANVHQSDEDTRHGLPAVYASLIKRVNNHKPVSFFLFENVPGLLSLKHLHRFEKLKVQLTNAGFEISEKRLNAADFGVPQWRERVFIVGINRQLHPAAKWHWPNGDGERKTVAQVIGHLPEPIYNQRGMDPALIPFHPNHWTMVPRSRKFSQEGALTEGQAWGRSFRTLAWAEPSWTVAYGNREVHVHPNGKRRLSVYEAMLLQTFPHHYVLTGNISAQIRLVSEAVPPQMGFALATAIRDCLEPFIAEKRAPKLPAEATAVGSRPMGKAL